jgi:hypothetical protein
LLHEDAALYVELAFTRLQEQRLAFDLAQLFSGGIGVRVPAAQDGQEERAPDGFI